MGLFDVVFHHGGEFVRDKRVFYRGGVQTIVSGLEGNNWGVSYPHFGPKNTHSNSSAIF